VQVVQQVLEHQHAVEAALILYLVLLHQLVAEQVEQDLIHLLAH
jgi:hypothetical protein